MVAAGGALGALARYGIARTLPTPPGTFPWATFWTNLSGAFVLGAFLTVLLERFRPTRYARAFVATGVLGAYTTFSTLAVETVTLVKDGHAPLGVSYLLATLAAGLVVAYLGVVVGRLLPHTRMRKEST